MLVSTNNTPKNKNIASNEEQRTIEKLRFLLKNSIQLNDELEKKNALLLYRIEQQQNTSQQSISQDDYKHQLVKLQKQLSEAQSENHFLQQSLKCLKQLGNHNNKSNFELTLQDCAVSQIEKQFLEYFEKSSSVVQEQMILEFQNLLEKLQTKYQIVEIHKITSFTNLDKTKCIESQQKEIDILELKLNNTEKELCDLKRGLESFQQQQSMKSSQQDQIHDFFNSNQFEVFTSRLNHSQRIEDCLSNDKRWIEIDNQQLKTDERKLIQYEKIIENQQLEIESLQNKVSNLSKVQLLIVLEKKPIEIIKLRTFVCLILISRNLSKNYIQFTNKNRKTSCLDIQGVRIELYIKTIYFSIQICYFQLAQQKQLQFKDAITNKSEFKNFSVFIWLSSGQEQKKNIFFFNLTIQYYSSIQQMRSKQNQVKKNYIAKQPCQHIVQSSQFIDTRKKFTYHSPNTNNSPVSITKSQTNNRSLRRQDSSNDQTTWVIKTTDASLVKKLDKKDSQSESTTDQVTKPTKLSSQLQEVKKSLDLMSNGICTQKFLKGYYFVQNKPILTLDDF